MVEHYCHYKISLKLIFATCRIGDYFWQNMLFLKCLCLMLFINLTVLAVEQVMLPKEGAITLDTCKSILDSQKGAVPIAVTKHLSASANYKANNFVSSFSLPNNKANMYKRGIIEALNIGDLDPNINSQVERYKLNLIQWSHCCNTLLFEACY